MLATWKVMKRTSSDVICGQGLQLSDLGINNSAQTLDSVVPTIHLMLYFISPLALHGANSSLVCSTMTSHHFAADILIDYNSGPWV